MNTFLQRVKVNEYLLPVVGKIPFRLPTSVVPVDGKQVWACWLERDGTAVLRSLVAEMGSGTGTKYMKQVMEWANELGSEILLEPLTTRNRRWYRKLGFVPARRKGWKGYMVWNKQEVK